ncbi:amino acid ABC transporter substrate-binding protein, PAAT family (TC 3.A.1.3.-) [Andreprevotia lacus DSM 23236]|jgi:polar amino acid transport system substrate-binding protein|uniref:Amino acid ABC transporter substrate-binding protein, PAAT family (TC 3.A.1.3.-) n=1 Tax=Andreprevotia lacus DSM 23236 TaxID=1121001 RepID=A0A1W1XEM2_9NEIS|nr:transporter substrate-binding domain-containing protein [Andreprevotia lacus]SMC22349.1 amino acid ABC transporter substrate-binding protein, PAAT family (TC 3.A.1.3.-) [Andreprevotia lacus DSM 23236]
MRVASALLLLCCTALAEAGPTLTLTLQEYPPFMGQSLPGRGLLSSAVASVFARAGYSVNFEPAPNNRAIEAPRRGMADGSFGWAKTPEREKDLYYTAPVMALRMVFCQRVEAHYEWQKLTDLAPYRIGTTLGNFYSDEFEKLARSGKLKVDPGPSDEANFRKLLADRVDLFPIDAEVGPYLMHQSLTPAERARLSCPDHAYWSAPLHVVISKARPDGQAIVAAFDEALQNMQRTGELNRLIDATRKQILQPTAY